MSDFVKFSEAVSIALHTVSYLSANADRLTSSSEIARELGVSENHLSKVLQRLSRAGIVESARGPGGGFRMNQGRSRMKLIEVYEAIEGPLSPSRCLLHPSICKGGRCKFGRFVRDTEAAARKILKETSLSEISKSFESRPEKTVGTKKIRIKRSS